MLTTCECGLAFGIKALRKHRHTCLEYRKTLPLDSYYTCSCGYMSSSKGGMASHQHQCVSHNKLTAPELIGEFKCICGVIYNLEELLIHHQNNCKINLEYEAVQKQKDPEWVRYPSWVHKFLSKLKSGDSWPNRYQIARELGIGLDEFTKYCSRHPELKTVVMQAEDVAIKALEKHCYEKARGLVKGGSDTLAIFMLNAHRPDKYKHPLRRDGPVGPVDIQFKIVPNKKVKE